MIRVEFIDPARLPARVPGIAIHRPDSLVFAMRDGLSADEVAHWITHLGDGVTREAADAAVARSKATAQP